MYDLILDEVLGLARSEGEVDPELFDEDCCEGGAITIPFTGEDEQ